MERQLSFEWSAEADVFTRPGAFAGPMTRTLTLLLALVLAAGALAGCAQNGGNDDGNGTPGGDGGDGERTSFKVGTDAAFPPFEDVAANGTIEGFDVDVIQEVARRNGWTLTIENRGFDTLIPSLQSGDLDIVISAMSINENRSQSVDFSTPYYEANQSIMQRAIDVTNNYTKLDDLRGKSLRFGAQSGTVAVDIIESEFTSKNDGSLKRYDTYPLALQALKTNEVDVVMMDAPAQREAAKGDPLVKFAFEFSTGDIYGIAVQKGDAETLGQINDALEAMENDGTLARLRETWGV